MQPEQPGSHGDPRTTSQENAIRQLQATEQSAQLQRQQQILRNILSGQPSSGNGSAEAIAGYRPQHNPQTQYYAQLAEAQAQAQLQAQHALMTQMQNYNAPPSASISPPPTSTITTITTTSSDTNLRVSFFPTTGTCSASTIQPASSDR